MIQSNKFLKLGFFMLLATSRQVDTQSAKNSLEKPCLTYCSNVCSHYGAWIATDCNGVPDFSKGPHIQSQYGTEGKTTLTEDFCTNVGLFNIVNDEGNFCTCIPNEGKSEILYFQMN